MRYTPNARTTAKYTTIVQTSWSTVLPGPVPYAGSNPRRCSSQGMKRPIAFATVLATKMLTATAAASRMSPKASQIGPKLSAKLSPVFRWKNYWETERRKVHVKPDKVTKILLAQHRTLEIERLKTGDTEIRLTRRSGLVTKARQASNGRMVILGGEDSSKDSFFVVIRSDEPKVSD